MSFEFDTDTPIKLNPASSKVEHESRSNRGNLRGHVWSRWGFRRRGKEVRRGWEVSLTLFIWMCKVIIDYGSQGPGRDVPHQLNQSLKPPRYPALLVAGDGCGLHTDNGSEFSPGEAEIFGTERPQAFGSYPPHRPSVALSHRVFSTFRD